MRGEAEAVKGGSPYVPEDWDEQGEGAREVTPQRGEDVLVATSEHAKSER